MDYTVHRILQARILEWVDFSFSSGFSWPRNWTRSPALQVDSLPAEHKGSPRILEWVAYPFSRGSSQPRDWTQVSHIAGEFFTSWATEEAHGYEIWTIIKAEHQRIDTFKLWCWRWHLRIPWTERRSNQSILKEINLEYSLEGLKLKLKLQYFGPLMWRTDSLEKTLCRERLRVGEKGDEMRWLDGIINSMDMSFRKLRERWRTGKPGVLQSTGRQRVRHNWVIE